MYFYTAIIYGEYLTYFYIKSNIKDGGRRIAAYESSWRLPELTGICLRTGPQAILY
jgi:hypothetical protein